MQPSTRIAKVLDKPSGTRITHGTVEDVQGDKVSVLIDNAATPETLNRACVCSMGDRVIVVGNDAVATVGAYGGGGGGSIAPTSSVLKGDGSGNAVAAVSGTDYMAPVTLATVATSGSYNDLTDKPTIPAAGLPTGGTSGQVLAKSSSTDYDVSWVNQSGGDASFMAETAAALVPNRVYYTKVGNTYTVVDVPDTDDMFDLTSDASVVPGKTYYTRREGVQLLNRGTDVVGYYINASGVFTAEAISEYSQLIPVVQGKTYQVSGISSAATNRRFHGYDAGGNWVQQLGVAASADTPAGSAYSKSFAIPSTVSYVRLSFRSADTDMLFKAVDDTTPIYTEVLNPVDADIATYYEHNDDYYFCVVDAATGATIPTMLDIYPVGSIYMSVNSTDPGLLFGGIWTRIKDTFLLSAGDTWSAGDTGGSKDAIVVSHSHTPMNTSFQFVSIGSGSGAVGVSKVANGSNSTNYFLRVANSDGMARSSTTGSTGDSGTDANMPPYLTVYMWKRTA